MINVEMNNDLKIAYIFVTTHEDIENNLIDSFVKDIHKNKSRLKKILKEEKENGKKIVAFGASGRATILLNYYELNKNIVSYIVDNSKLSPIS